MASSSSKPLITMDLIMEGTRVKQAVWAANVKPELWGVPVTQDSDASHLTTFAAYAILSYQQAEGYQSCVDDELLVDFQERFEDWTLEMFKDIELNFRRELRVVLREGGLYTGRLNAKIADSLFNLLSLVDLPIWPEEELAKVDFGKSTQAYKDKLRIYGPDTVSPPAQPIEPPLVKQPTSPPPPALQQRDTTIPPSIPPLLGLTKGKNPKTLPAAPRMSIPDKAPFMSVGDWSDALISNVEVVIGQVEETTSDFTKSKSPDSRYWKAPVSFKCKGSPSRIIKMNMCDVPFVKSTKYGVDFVYARLQPAVGDAIVKAAFVRGIRVTRNDRKLAHDENSWWATINGLSGRIGIIDGQGKFEPWDLSAVLQKTEQGVEINFDLVFNLKFSTRNKVARDAASVFGISAECSRGAIKEIRVDIEAPVIESAVPTQPASRMDIAPQELIDILDSLSL